MKTAAAWLGELLEVADSVIVLIAILLVAAVVVLGAGLFLTGIWSWS